MTDDIEDTGEPQETDLITATEPETEPAVAVEGAPEPEVGEEDETAKRLSRLAHDAREARREARALRAENERLRGQRAPEPPDVEMDRKVTERAAQIAAERLFNDRCNQIYDLGVKEFSKPAFDKIVAACNEPLGFIPVQLIDAATDAGEPHRILNYLGSNPDVLEDMLALPPHRMGAAIAKLAVKVSPQKQVSKAPPPSSKTVSGHSKAPVDPDKMSISDYMKYEDERLLQKRLH